jgi:hypothetical protein
MTVRLLFAVGASAAALARVKAGNERLTAEFGDRGLVSLKDHSIARSFDPRDGFAVTTTAGNRARVCPRQAMKTMRGGVRLQAGPFEIHVGYEAAGHAIPQQADRHQELDTGEVHSRRDRGVPRNAL